MEFIAVTVLYQSISNTLQTYPVYLYEKFSSVYGEKKIVKDNKQMTVGLLDILACFQANDNGVDTDDEHDKGIKPTTLRKMRKKKRIKRSRYITEIIEFVLAQFS